MQRRSCFRLPEQPQGNHHALTARKMEILGHKKRLPADDTRRKLAWDLRGPDTRSVGERRGGVNTRPPRNAARLRIASSG